MLKKKRQNGVVVDIALLTGAQ